MDSFDRVRAFANDLKSASDGGNPLVKQIYVSMFNAYAELPEEFLKELWETYDPSVKVQREMNFLVTVGTYYSTWKSLFGAGDDLMKEVPKIYGEVTGAMRSRIRKKVTAEDYIRSIWKKQK